MRYWLSATIFLAGLVAMCLLIGWGAFGLNPIVVAVVAAVAYVLGLTADVLPPGRWRRGDSTGNDEEQGFMLQDGEEPDERRRTNVMPFVVGGGAVLLLTTGIAVVLANGVFSGSGEEQSATTRTTPPVASAAAAIPTPSLVAISTVTSTAIATPTATPTVVPPTPASRPSPTVAPTRTPTPGLSRQQEAASNLTGGWLVSDTVTNGPGAGQTFVFSVSLNDDGRVVTGGGSGLSLRGARQGSGVEVVFTRTGGAQGRFTWTLSDSGDLVGTFADDGAQNSGTSVGKRS